MRLGNTGIGLGVPQVRNDRPRMMENFDALPPRLRRLIAEAPFNLDTTGTFAIYASHGEAEAERCVRRVMGAALARAEAQMPAIVASVGAWVRAGLEAAARRLGRRRRR